MPDPDACERILSRRQNGEGRRRLLVRSLNE